MLLLVGTQLLALHLSGFDLTASEGFMRAPATKNKTIATTAAVRRQAVTGALAE